MNYLRRGLPALFCIMSIVQADELLAADEAPRFYSLITYPSPERISSGLKSTYEKLSQIDPRNDSQVIFYDQIIPGSVVMGFVNADHWAIAVPISRRSAFLSSTLVNKNDFSQEVLLEAVVRFVEEDLENIAATEPGVMDGP